MEYFTSIEPKQLQKKIARFRQFSGMADTTLDVFVVTPLNNFSFNEMHLDRISYDFTKHIQKAQKYENIKGALSVLSKSPNLPAISVQAIENDNRCVFNANLLSVSSSVAAGTRVSLPFMCVMANSKAGLLDHIRIYLEKRFSCAINKCELSHSQFQWLLGISVNETLVRCMNEGITLTYAVNGILACIHQSLSPEELAAVWEECTNHGREGSNLYFTSVGTFTVAVDEHFFKTYGVDCSSMPLERFVLDGVSIARLKTLRLKVRDAGLIFVLLKFIDHACIKCSPFYSTGTEGNSQ